MAVVRVSGAGLGILLLRNREVVLCPIRSVDEVAGVLDGEMDCAIGRQDALAAVLAVFVWLVRIDDAVLGAAVVGIEDLAVVLRLDEGPLQLHGVARVVTPDVVLRDGDVGREFYVQ